MTSSLLADINAYTKEALKSFPIDKRDANQTQNVRKEAPRAQKCQEY